VRSFGYTLAEWDAEGAANRARVIGHYLHRMQREGYESEMARKAAKNSTRKKDRSDADSPSNDNFRYRQNILQERLRRKQQRAGDKPRVDEAGGGP